jgi:pimeloyl-ACP methyl ester carboxylesterase
MQADVLYVKTQDGWQLALHHWPHRGKKRRLPILMVHGLAANRHNLDLDERHSVARFARDRGFEVYILEMRGAGLSRPPGGRDRALFQWGFEEHKKFDLPSAVRFVLEHARTEQLHGLGHSMGGMLFYAHAVEQVKTLRSITTVGSPLISRLNLGPREKRLIQLGMRLAPSRTMKRVPIKNLVGVAGRFVPLSARLADGMLLNVANTEPEVIGRMAREGINDVPLQMLLEMWAQMNEPVQSEGPYAHESRLGEIQVPVQAISGNVDNVAPYAAVEAAVARLDGPDVRYRKMGRPDGDRADYGHGDLLVGRAAPEEVFPMLVDFIEEMD